jgi:hypothetical protein
MSAPSKTFSAGVSGKTEKSVRMITLQIRYTLDIAKIADFEAYAKALLEPIARCGGSNAQYYLSTKIAGPTNQALALIDFSDLASYERYRANLLSDAGAVECLRRVETSGAILNEDRSFIRRVA